MWSLPTRNNIPPFVKLELTPLQVVPSWKRNAGTLSRAKPGNTLFPSAPRAFWAFWAERGLVVRDRHHFVHFHIHRSLSKQLSRIFSPSGERSNFPSPTESRVPRLVKPWWPSVASSRAQGSPGCPCCPGCISGQISPVIVCPSRFGWAEIHLWLILIL